MKSPIMLGAGMVAGRILLAGCSPQNPPVANNSNFTAISQKLVAGADAACVRETLAGSSTARETCQLALELRHLWMINLWLEGKLEVTVPRVGCEVVDCGEPWVNLVNQIEGGGLEKGDPSPQPDISDPSPQPNAPLPFNVVPPNVQLDYALEIRSALVQAEAGLDAHIERLKQEVGQNPDLQ